MIAISALTVAMLVTCDYQFMGVPTTQIELQLADDETPPEQAKVNMQGRTHFESVTRETTAPSELVHVWLSKESKENAVEMIVYREPQKAGQSVLINHNVPFGKEMWGTCTGIGRLAGI